MEVTIKSITSKDICQYIAEFARVCTRRDEKLSTSEQDLNRCNSLWKMGHGTPFESINIDFLIEGVSRSLLAQITRYRHASYNVESQRYVKYDKDTKFIEPSSFKDANSYSFAHSMAYSLERYRELIVDGAKPEDARCVLPNATPTRFRMVVNLREFFHIYQQRSKPEAQKEIRDLVDLMFNKLYEYVDNNSQKLLTLMRINVKLSIQSLIKDIENNPDRLSAILQEYKELC